MIIMLGMTEHVRMHIGPRQLSAIRWERDRELPARSMLDLAYISCTVRE